MGVICSDFGDSECVIRYFRESFIVVENVGDKLVIGEFYGGLGSVFYKIIWYLEVIFYNEKYFVKVKEVKDKES